MKKDKVIANLEKAWGSFKDSFRGLSEAWLLTPGVTDDWSVRDILAHVSWWEREALKHLPVVLVGGRPPRYSVTYGGIDAFNARMTGEKQGLSLAQVMEELDRTHAELLHYLADVGEEHFRSETRFRRRLRLDTYSHYPLHTQAILDWKKKQGLE